MRHLPVLWQALVGSKLRLASIDPLVALEEPTGDPTYPLPVASDKNSGAGDSAESRENMMTWCESQGIDYVFGLASNEALSG